MAGPRTHTLRLPAGNTVPPRSRAPAGRLARASASVVLPVPCVPEIPTLMRAPTRLRLPRRFYRLITYCRPSPNCIQSEVHTVWRRSDHRRWELSMSQESAAPADFLTLVMPLTARQGMTNADFYDYWLNAHVTLPARFPGITTVWLHSVSFEDAVWPRLPGVSHRPPAEDEFQGVPEATFAAEDGLAEFQGANKVQMDEGINFLQEIITYLSPGAATETVA